VPHSKNQILARISRVDLEDLRPNLRVVDLKHGQVLADSRERVRQVYFPHGGILSCVVELADGSTIETGMIGRDGVFGATLALDDKLSLNKVMVQVPAQASVVNAEHLRAVAQSSPDLLRWLAKYETFFLAQVQQMTACNALHTVEQRMCKWLVRMHDLTGDELPLTQEFMAQMMGVRRTSVTTVASHLQKQGLISYRRGHVRILDIRLVEKYSCECHNTIREHYAEEFGPTTPAQPGSGLRSIQP
jgi:CRP-like cAMP-binding protein